MNCNVASLRWVFLLISLAAFFPPASAEDGVRPTPFQLLNEVIQWRGQLRSSEDHNEIRLLDAHTITAAVLCFAATSISGAGGVGGGALFVPILNLVAGLRLKSATGFSAIMVTGGAVSNVLYNVFSADYIDYDLALLLQPCMLLGVTLGVICNVVFPEWLVAVLFVLLLAWSTFKTCSRGVTCWKAESESTRERFCKLECGEVDKEKGGAGKSVEYPLLGDDTAGRRRLPRKKMGLLPATWVSFLLYLMLGMEGVEPALCLAGGCFLFSLVGLILVQRAVDRCGRPSLIVFSISTVMFLSMLSMACFGAIDVWRDYVDGRYMGFRLPC